MYVDTLYIHSKVTGEQEKAGEKKSRAEQVGFCMEQQTMLMWDRDRQCPKARERETHTHI